MSGFKRLWFPPFRLFWPTAVLIVSILFGVSCADRSESPADQRARRAAKAKGDIKIALAVSMTGTSDAAMNGAKLAVKHINEHGGVLGRKLSLTVVDDQADVNKAKLAIQPVVDDLDTVAVIGHSGTYISKPISTLYQYYGILMISPFCDVPGLSKESYVICTHPDDDEVAGTLVRYALLHGLKRVAIYNSNDLYGRRMANFIATQAENRGLLIVERISFSPTDSALRHRKNMEYLKDNYEFDAIALAAQANPGVDVAKAIRAAGIAVPLLVSGSYYSSYVAERLGSSETNLFIACEINLSQQFEPVQQFVREYMQEYGRKPGATSLRACHAVSILAHAITAAGTTVPKSVEAKIKNSVAKDDLIPGQYMDESGDFVAKKMYILQLSSGEFEPVQMIDLEQN